MANGQLCDWESKRARYAWERTGEAQRSLDDSFKDYANLAKSAPALIMNSGLMQTLAFLQSKDKQSKDKQSKDKHHQTLVNQICAWLWERFEALPDRPQGRAFEQVMDWLAQADGGRYRLATREVMSLLRWIKQFAAAREEG